MRIFRRLFTMLQPTGTESSFSPVPDSLDCTLGIELTRLPPAPDLSYHVMHEDGRRAGILLVSESGRMMPFLGTWVEDAGGLWHSDAELARIASTSPIPVMPTTLCADKRLEPPVAMVPLSGPGTGHRVYVLRRFGLAMKGLDKATFFLRHDWIQAVVWPPSPDEPPSSLSAFMGVQGNGEVSALILPSWWHESLCDELAESARGGEPISPWEEQNKLWRIPFPERLKDRLATWKRDVTKLPDEAGGPEALAHLERFLESGLARGLQFHQTLL